MALNLFSPLPNPSLRSASLFPDSSLERVLFPPTKPSILVTSCSRRRLSDYFTSSTDPIQTPTGNYRMVRVLEQREEEPALLASFLMLAPLGFLGASNIGGRTPFPRRLILSTRRKGVNSNLLQDTTNKIRKQLCAGLPGRWWVFPCKPAIVSKGSHQMITY